MFENLDVFRMSHAMAKHAGTRQAVVAKNMANADTPGYVAQEIAPFKDMVNTQSTSFSQLATRQKHLNGLSPGSEYDVFDRPGAQTDPNGNSVSVESEMVHAVDTKRQHDRAVMIYKSALTVLRTAVRK